MKLSTDHLSMWEIGFRWHGHNPDWPIFKKIPIEVRDVFRNISEGLLNQTLTTLNLIMEKPQYKPGYPKDMYFYTYLDQIHYINQGLLYPRKIIKHIRFERVDFIDWCIKDNISPPSFWISTAEVNASNPNVGRQSENRSNKEACRQIAIELWAEDPQLTIKSIIFHDRIQELRPGNPYKEKTLRNWVKDLDPRDPAQKPGRPSKN